MPRVKQPKSEEARRAQLRLLLAAAGFFVIAVFGSVLALGWEILHSSGMRNVMEAWQQRYGAGQTDAQAEAEMRAKVENDRRKHDDTALVTDTYEYGDWLYRADRPAEAKALYEECAAAAKRSGSKEWYPTALAREGYAMHHIFLKGGALPDTAATEEAARIETDGDNRASWLTILGLLYTDRGEFSKAQSTFAEARPLAKSEEEANNLALATAQLELRRGDLNAAATATKQLKGEVDRSDWRDLKQVAESIDASPARRALRAKISKLWKAHDYAALDELAVELRKEPGADETATGQWQLQNLYDVIPDAAMTSENSVQQSLAACDAWSKAMPSSVTPHILAARIWRDYAWKARGSGWADSVSSDAWKLFEQRLVRAHAQLDLAAKTPERCPFEITTAQGVALGQSMDKADYAALVNKGLKRYPTFIGIYTSQAWYLQPRWFGADGEWNKVAQQECDKLGGTTGDIMYARVVHSLMPFYDNVFTEAGADRERTKRGYEALRKKFPKSAELVLTEAQLRLQADAPPDKAKDAEED